MFRSIFIFAAFILLIFANSINATTYYVDNVGGNDGNSGMSTLLAWKTIAKVAGFTFQSGDIVSLKCGNRFYVSSEMSEVGKAGVTFNSYGTGARPVIDAQFTCTPIDFGVNTGTNHVTFNGIKIVHGYPANVSMYKCSYITFESCNIDSNTTTVVGTGGNPQCMYSGEGDHLTVRNSTLSYSGNGNGVYLDGTDDCLFEYDTLYNNLHDGFRIAGGDDLASTLRLTVRYCVIKYNHNAQIENSGAKDSYFYYNLIITNPNNVPYDEASGLKLHDQGLGFCPVNCYYYNNTIITNRNYNNEMPAIRIQPTSNMTNIVFKNNIIYCADPTQYMQYWQQVRGDGVISSYIFTNNLYYQPSPNTNLFKIWSPLANNGTYTTLSSWQSTSGYESNSIWGVPLFTDTTNEIYTLQSGSPAYSTGTNVGLTQDINGNPVPSGSPDIGAYQHAIASPTTYYVANNGNDANSGTTTSLPWKTISKVNSKIFNPGDIILFRRGDTWSEILTPQGSGNATSPITYDAYGTGNLPIIDGGTINNNCISIISVNYITIRNFRVQYAAVNTNGDIHAQYTGHLKIENCDIYVTSHGGIFLESSANDTIRNCTMSSPVSNNNNQADGIYSQRNSNCIYEDNSIVISDMGTGHNDGIQSYLDTNMTFRNNYIYQNNSLTLAQGIDISDGAGTFYVYNNVVKCPNSTSNIIGFNNDVSGTGALRCYQNTVLGNINCLRILKCADVSIKNNIFYTNNATSIIDIGATLNPSSEIDYNLYNRSGSGSMVLYEPQGYMTYAQWQAAGYETHGLNTNPIVDDTLCPAINSPVVNVGTNLGGIYSYDKNGTLRPVNGVDLGAYELKSAPVPVELTSFSGILITNSVSLSWSTATEVNNQGFDIEKNTNTSWVKIGFVEGKGNSVTKNNYTFIDKDPIGYKLQYRLKQIDNNGNFKYSDIVTITAIPKDFSLGNYPNPFNPSTKIRYTVSSESMINLVIYNIIGERIDELKNEPQQTGTYEINWNGNGHPSGIYLLSIIESPTDGSAKNSKTIKMSLIK